MYPYLLTLHSIVRWFVLFFIVYTLYRAYRGYTQNRMFSKTDNAFRHWTATFTHIQLMIGIVLYTQSPAIHYFWSDIATALRQPDTVFYAAIHSFLMLTAIVIITIGSALAKRKATDKEKFRILLLWFSIALFIVFIAIPWPFSPLANRPYLRMF